MVELQPVMPHSGVPEGPGAVWVGQCRPQTVRGWDPGAHIAVTQGAGFARARLLIRDGDAVWGFVDGRMLGLPRRDIDHDLPLARWGQVMSKLQGFQAWDLHGDWVRAHPGVLGPEITTRFRAAATISSQEYAAAVAEADRARTAIRARSPRG